MTIWALLWAGTALAAESATLLKADDLKAEPFRDAKTVSVLAAGSSVSVLKKDGGWLQVQAGKSKGWVRMLSVRQGAAAKSASGASQLAGLASGRAGTGKVVATTGIRGLNEEELKAAHFDAAQLQRLETYTATADSAADFAKQGKLKARSVEYLPAVK